MLYAGPKPKNIKFEATIVFDWQCPHCRSTNVTRRDSKDEYIALRCGHCHLCCLLDYHREQEAPLAALALDAIALGPHQGRPWIPQKSALNPPKGQARATLKSDARKAGAR